MTDENKAELRAKTTYEMAVNRARGTAEHFKPGYGTQELKPDDEMAVWMDTGGKQWAPEEIHAMYQAGLTQQQIGLKMYPERERLVKGGGRIEPRQWVAKAQALAKRYEIQQAGTLEAVKPPEMEGGY